MPAFEVACALYHERKLHGKVGVHLNLTEGPPLTQAIAKCPRFVRDAKLATPRRCFYITSDERRAVEIELAAQIQAVLDQGLRPSHLDSHHHVHTEWPIGSVVMDLARRFSVPAVRIARNCGVGISAVKRLYKNAYNARLRWSGYARTQYFGSATDFLRLASQAALSVEVCVHPMLDESGRIICAVSKVDLEASIARVRERGKFVSFADLTETASRGRW
jgi:predicted glycoside hydrolase/deacetylase ChbG (UPF0249 family)